MRAVRAVVRRRDERPGNRRRTRDARRRDAGVRTPDVRPRPRRPGGRARRLRRRRPTAEPDQRQGRHPPHPRRLPRPPRPPSRRCSTGARTTPGSTTVGRARWPQRRSGAAPTPSEPCSTRARTRSSAGSPRSRQPPSSSCRRCSSCSPRGTRRERRPGGGHLAGGAAGVGRRARRPRRLLVRRRPARRPRAHPRARRPAPARGAATPTCTRAPRSSTSTTCTRSPATAASTASATPDPSRSPVQVQKPHRCGFRTAPGDHDHEFGQTATGAPFVPARARGSVPGKACSSGRPASSPSSQAVSCGLSADTVRRRARGGR